MQKKFALTNETRVISNQILYRIKALKDFDDVKTGDLGGFIEKEANLSHDGNCWVYDKACVYGYAVVAENAKIRHFSQVCGQVYGNCEIYGKAFISQYAKIYDHACVYGNAHVSYDATVFSYARVYGRAIVAGSARIHSYAKVLFYTKVWGRAYGNAKLTKKSKVKEVPINYEVYESDNLVKIVDETE
ncbi:carbonic anhydrase/acetyltransferase-like protein (isoleucine patch superfamily) [Bartonella silvatica]|uniref:Carbonic anhydrase/acetyltransferase-like protein (Isoleucine patch superfamily) n=1 Tax=Bartonella silvatica TaxID=357760 RepID=A0ABV2HHW9_9HYPH